MISEDNLAAAQIAQIFGSELLKAQQNARTDAGSVPNFVTVDPKQFLINKNSNQSRMQQNEMLQALQREAEMAYPLPQISESPITQPNKSTIKESKSSNIQIQLDSERAEIKNSSEINTILEKILHVVTQINDKLKN